MTAPTRYLPATLRRVLPIVVPIAIVAAGLLLFVQPSLSSALRAASEAGQLESRIVSLRRLVTTGGATADGRGAVLAEFARRVPLEDRTPELVEQLARLALDPPDTTQARGLVIDTGRRVRSDDTPAAGAPRPAAPLAPGLSVDARWRLFPVALAYTPITVSFRCTYDRLGRVLWRLRGLPTLVEVHDLEVTRALPLLKVTMVIYALQRLGPVTASTPAPQVPMAPGDPATIPAPPPVDMQTAPSWPRDPFLAHGETRNQAVAAATPERAEPDPVVQSILYSSERRLALVDRRILKVGDHVGAATIIDIQPTAIVLRQPGGRTRRVELARMGGSK